MTFPAYPAYKASGVEWLGDVPIDWALSKVKYDSYVKARVGWHGLKSDEFTDVGPYLVTGSDFKNRTVEWASCYHCTNERFEQDKYIQLEEGDLLITKDGTIGKLILVEGLPGKATLNSGIFVVRPLQQKYSTRFYFWIMQSSVFHEFIGLNKTGSTIIHLYQETFENLPYALPPLAEQTKIARFLDHETARIDALIEEQQRLIELLKEKRQAVISHAVTKGLDPTVPMKDSGVEWLGEVPAHWDVKKLKYGVNVIGGFAFQSSDFIDEGVQLIKIGNLYENEFQLDRQPTYLNSSFLTSHNAWVVSRGDLLMSLTGTLGKRDYGSAVLIECDGKYLLNQRVAKLKIYDLFDGLFLKFLLHSDGYLNKIYSLPSGTKQANLSNDDVVSVEVSVPALKEQENIAAFLVSETEKVAFLIADAELVISILNERRSALISAAVTGKIDVRGWQPLASTPIPELAQEAV
jgi:type I restriction enzyme S subunit